MTNTLKLVLTDHWFEEIKAGRKKYEYRKVTDFWKKRLLNVEFTSDTATAFSFKPFTCVEFRKAYRKNAERMTFAIKDVDWFLTGMETDLKCPEQVFSIKLGERIK